MSHIAVDLRQRIHERGEPIVRCHRRVHDRAVMILAPAAPAVSLGGRDTAGQALREEHHVQAEVVAVDEAAALGLAGRTLHEEGHLFVVAPRGGVNDPRQWQAARHVERQLVVETWIEVDEQEAVAVLEELELEEPVVTRGPDKSAGLLADGRVERRIFEAKADAEPPRPLEIFVPARAAKSRPSRSANAAST